MKRYRLHSGAVVSERQTNSDKDPCVGQFFIPCGQCGECRLSRARMWATRCTHEAQQWKLSSFITLTYKESPKDNSLNPEDTRNFIRRFRRSFKKPFKYFLVGEYGEKNLRPHYHALIFGHDFGFYNRSSTHEHIFSDMDLRKTDPELQPIEGTSALRSPELDDLWELGHTSVGALTFDSAAYCAQYAMKKVNGSNAREHYNGRLPEFMRCSQDAIGKQYAHLYAQEIITNNAVLSNGVKQPIPPYYLKQYEKQNLPLSHLKSQRELYSSSHSIEKSYIRAQMLDSKFKLKISKQDAFRIRYANELFAELTP